MASPHGPAFSPRPDAVPEDLLLPHNAALLSPVACVATLDRVKDVWQRSRNRAALSRAFHPNAAALGYLFAQRVPTPPNPVLAAAYQMVLVAAKLAARAAIHDAGGDLIVALVELAQHLGSAGAVRHGAASGAWVTARSLLRVGDTGLFADGRCAPRLIAWVADTLERHAGLTAAAAAPPPEERKFVVACLERLGRLPHPNAGAALRRLRAHAEAALAGITDGVARGVVLDFIARSADPGEADPGEADRVATSPAPAAPHGGQTPAQAQTPPSLSLMSPLGTALRPEEGPTFTYEQVAQQVARVRRDHEHEVGVLERMLGDERRKNTLLRDQLEQARELQRSLAGDPVAP